MERKRPKKKQQRDKPRYRTDYTTYLFGEHTTKNLNFLQKPKLDEQFQKLRELLKASENGPIESFIPTADSLYANNIVKREIYSSGIKSFDSMFSSKGILSGDIIEICGKTQSGKSVLIHTILANILKEHRDIKVVYFDTKEDFQTHKFVDFLMTHGLQNDEATQIADRVAMVKITNIFDLIHGLQQLIDPHRTCHMFRREFDIAKTRFIIINSITIPFFHSSSSFITSKKVTSDVHNAIQWLSKNYGITFFITNLALNKQRVSESDQSAAGDDPSSISSSQKSARDPIDDVQAALDDFWSEFLNYRFVITAISRNCDIFGFIEIPRKITLVESRTEKCEKSIVLKITELGMA